MITTPNDLLTISQLRAELKAVKAERDALRAALVDLLALTDELLDVDGPIAQALPQQVHFPADLMTDEQVLRLDNACRLMLDEVKG